MKKITAIFVAMIMALSLSITVFAEDSVEKDVGTFTLSVDIPATGGYTLHIPASMELKYGDTSWQNIGEVYVSDVINQSIDMIDARFPFTPLTNVEDPEDVIPLDLRYRATPDDDITNTLNEDEDGNEMWLILYDNSRTDCYLKHILCTQVKNWFGATSGATYHSTVTIQIKLLDLTGNDWR